MRKPEGLRWNEVSPIAPDRSVRFFAVAAFAALALSACQEPAGVGLGLIDEEQSDPSVRVVTLGDVDTLTFDVPSIGIADPSNSNARPISRVLVGDVQDAVFGDARGIGYVDAIQPTEDLPDAADIRQVWLEMPRLYTYGDTTTTLPVSLHEIQGSWDASRDYRRDTTFSVGPALTASNVTVADSLIRFTLPASWVTANAAKLVSSTFQDDFEGFALQAAAGFTPAPGVVYGLGTFNTQGAGLRVTTATDTLLYRLSEVFSSLTSEAPTAAPASLLPIRRNSGGELRFSADLGEFGPVPLARGVLRLPLDRSYAEVGTFVRPLASRSALFGIRNADSDTPIRVALGIVAIGDDDEAVLVDTRPFTTALQRMLINPATGAFDRYEILPDLNRDLSPASLDILPLLLPGPGQPLAPRVTLTLVGAPA